MDKTRISAITLLMVLISTNTLLNQVSVGAKKGDWIEYHVTIMGTAPQDHNITWGRMEITTIQGNNINLAIATKFSNGTLLNETITLDLETGALGDDFIIPANLNTDDAFFDSHQGYITITGTEEKTYAGASRTIVTGATPQTTYYWDKTTGVLVEATTAFTYYSMHTIVDKTNMWQPEIRGLYPIVFYALTVVAVIAIAIIIVAIFRHRKNNNTLGSPRKV
jgi:hypothetical protein